jgi:drug/metabolite transporter (DMT)-like permease
MGAFGVDGHDLPVAAHQHAPAPLRYTRIVPMLILGYLVFGDVPDALTVTGAVVVLASGLYVRWRERVIKRDL